MKRVITCGVRCYNDEFIFDYTSDRKSDILDLMGPHLLESEFQNNVYWFGYQFNKDSSSADRTKFIHYLKGLAEPMISSSELHKFLSQPLKELSKLINLHSLDCLIYPRSGRSNLVPEIVSIINDWSSRSIKRSTFEVVKSTPADIEFDWDRFRSEVDEDSLRYKQMSKYIKEVLLPSVHSLEYFSLASSVKKKYRRYIKNFLSLESGDAEEQLRNLKGQNILVVDDINTSGSTLHEILRILSGVNTDCNIYVYTLIGTRNN